MIQLVRFTEDGTLGCNKEITPQVEKKGIIFILTGALGAINRTISHSSNQDHIYCGMESIHLNEGNPLYFLCGDCYLESVYGGDE
tara:strand:+ start:1206 stop:1460 length:255 start_codon:yes stop_codon:yes gene_type:complete